MDRDELLRVFFSLENMPLEKVLFMQDLISTFGLDMVLLAIAEDCVERGACEKCPARELCPKRSGVMAHKVLEGEVL